MYTKEQARKLGKKFREELSETERSQFKDTIKKQLFSMEIFQKSTWIFTFVSYGNEVDTQCMIQNLLNNPSYKEKRVAVPKVVGREMVFFEITDWKDLKPGYHGILEPMASKEVEIQATEGIVLMPGLAFDEEGNRVGYGGGYYDRYFASLKEMPYKVAICFDCQILSGIRGDDFDIKPNIIITEKRLIQTGIS